MPETTLIVLLPLVLLGAGAVTATVFFFSLRREMCALRRRMATLEGVSNEVFVNLQNRVADLSERLRLAEEHPIIAPTANRCGVNLTNRAQALRMLRRGIAAETIATSLNLPRPEIELLIRVQQLAAASDNPTSETTGG